MIGPLIWKANESGHHDLSTAVQSLRRYVDECQSCYAGTTCSGATTEEHVQRQVVQAEFVKKNQVCPTVQITGQKVRSNDVVSKNTGPSNDTETLLSRTWLHSIRILQSPLMNIVLIEDSVTCEVCFIHEKYGRCKCAVCSTFLQEPCRKRLTE